MTASIRETITNTLGYGASQYASYVDQVVNALEQREQDIAGQILDAAESAGVSTSDAESALRDAGLISWASSTVDAESTQDSGSDVEARLARIEQRLDEASRLASQQFGVRI